MNGIGKLLSYIIGFARVITGGQDSVVVNSQNGTGQVRVNRFEPYGLTSNVQEGKVLIVRENGNLDTPIAITCAGGTVKPTANPNEVIVYNGNNKITVKNNEIEIVCGAGRVVVKNSGKIEIGTEAVDLITEIDSIITALQSAVVVTPAGTFNPGTIANFTAIQTRLNTIRK